MRLALLFLAAALLARAPGLLHLDLNWDEALYWIIAGEVAQGHVPLSLTWDRKPPGLFIVLAAPRAVFGDSMLVPHLSTIAGVAAVGLALTRIARLLLPGWPRWNTLAGVVAGFAYAGFTMSRGGEGANAELVLAPFAVWGIALALTAAHGMRLGAAIAAGVLLGIAVTVKQVALFDGLAAGLMVLAGPWAAGLRARLRLVACMAMGGVAAPLLILVWYLAAGQGALLVDNLLAAGEAGGAALNPGGLLAAAQQLRALMLGFALGLVALLLVGERWAALGLAIWSGSIAAVLVLLGRFADHMWLQAMPPMALGCGALAATLGRRLPARLGPAAAVLAGLALLALGARVPWAAAVEVVQRRLEGSAHWGDRSATIGAAIGGRIKGSRDIFVLGRSLGVYLATGQAPPARLVFSWHFWAPYAPLDGMAELERIMAARPRFVVVDEAWLPGGAGLQSPAHARLMDRLAALLEAGGYVRDGRVGRFRSRGGGFIGGGDDAVVFRRPDVPPWAGGQIQYEP